jgi:hypothetical protein
VSPVELFARIDPGPGLWPRSIHDYLRSSVASAPVEYPVDGSLCSEGSKESLTSPISISDQGLHRNRGAIPFKPSDGGDSTAILGPHRRHPNTVTGQHTK